MYEGRYYAVEVCYGTVSSVTTAYSHDVEVGLLKTREQAKATLIHYVNFYAELGETIRDVSIKSVCATCDGRGTVIERKQLKTKVKHVEKRCPQCKSKSHMSEITII